MKKAIRPILCVSLVVIILLSFAACSSTSESIVGTWISNDEDSRAKYVFDEMTGEKGNVSVTRGSVTIKASYYYYTIEDNQVTIKASFPSLTSDKNNEPYDTLTILESDGVRCLVSAKTGRTYYLKEAN